jgi:hypothetical protein
VFHFDPLAPLPESQIFRLFLQAVKSDNLSYQQTQPLLLQNKYSSSNINVFQKKKHQCITLIGTVAMTVYLHLCPPLPLLPRQGILRFPAAENAAVLSPAENLLCLSAAAEFSVEDALDGRQVISLGKTLP